jgi:O-antigen/teichoic acid export membrane protein
MKDSRKGNVGNASTVSPHNLLLVAKGGGFLTAGELFNYASRLVASLVLARVLGADEYGLYTLSVSLAFLVAGLANLGLDAAMERYIAILRARGDEPGVRGTLQLGIGLPLIASLVLSTIGFFAAGSIAQNVFHDDRLIPLLQIVALAMPLVVSTTMLSAIVRGFKRMAYSAFTVNFIQPLVRLTLIGVLAIVGLNAKSALIIFAVSYLAASIVLLGLVHKLCPLDRLTRDSQRYAKEIAAFSFPFWFAGVLTQVRQNLAPVLLGVYSSIANVGIYSVVTSATLLGRVAAKSIRTSLRPTLAEALDAGDTAQAEHLYQSTTRWTLTSNLPVFLVIILYPSAILSLFGGSFESGAAPLSVLAWAQLANAATGTCGSVIDMSGLNLVKLMNKIFEFALTLTLSVVLIVQWGLMGAAVATLISTVVIQILRVVEVRVIVGLNPYSVRTLKPVLAAVVALVAGTITNLWIPATDGLVHLLLNAAVIVVVYFGTLVALGLTEEDRSVMRAVARKSKLPVPHFLR